MTMGRVRLRLTFDGHILSKAQEKEEGLKKSWILLNPKHYKTISDFCDYLFHSFQLRQSCPHGLVLSMNGFVLPPSESTRILKDDDVVCVRKKVGSSIELLKPGNGVNALGQLELVQQPVPAGLKLLANEEFEKEIGGYESESEEDDQEKSPNVLEVEHTPIVEVVSKKRKASDKLQGTKRKKSKVAAEETPVAVEDDENDERVVKSGNSRGKKRSKKGKSSDVQVEPKKLDAPGIDETSNWVSKSMPSANRISLTQDNGQGNMDASATPETKKVPSRSARRKKAKRQWLREHTKIQKMELQQKQALSKDNQQPPNEHDQNLSGEPREPVLKSGGKDNGTLSKIHGQPDANSDVNDDVVPVVIRPGHIRFEPLGGDAIQAVQENQRPVETFQWNGITSKKKGQKWGTEKAASSKRNNYENATEEDAEIPTKKGNSTNDGKVSDFDKLRPYTSMPKEGDVIAYRLIELSSGWTPEPTSFRVGKISWVDSHSNKVMLLPVPEYPITFEKKTDEDGTVHQSDTSLYGADGSLLIDFLLLVDVRAIKQGDSKDANSVNGGVGEVHLGWPDAAPNLKGKDNNEKARQPTQENGDVNAWEEISQALSAKKAQLSNVNDSSTKENSGKSRPSNKALKSSALGPTMTFLRANNVL